MDNLKLEAYIRSIDPELEATLGIQFVEVKVANNSLHSFAKRLRDDKETQFNFLFCLSGVDYGIELGVIYHLRSTFWNHTIVLKTFTADRENPHFDSVTDIWQTAEFHEREAFDLLGIKFSNHPDLRRLFLDKTWGFPLRKDYNTDINIA